MTTTGFLRLDHEQDRDMIVGFNKALVERHPYLLPRNRFTGEVPEDYDWTWTELDDMPRGWRIAFADEMCDRITEVLKKAGYLKKYRIAQIKEKWGRLCWYDSGAPEGVHEIIYGYERKSESICICCGKPAQWISRGWISPYCVVCAKGIPNRRFPEGFELIRKPDLSGRQAEVLRMIRDYRFVTGESPTYREIGERLGMTRQGAWDAVRILRAKGYIEPGKGHRNIVPEEEK